jgi:GLPGLI family protein
MSKNFINIFLFGFLCLNLFGQQKAVIIYEETFHFEIPEELKSRMPANMPTKSENAKILEIVGNQSYFKTVPVKEEDVPNINNPSGNRGGFRGPFGRMGGGSEETFTDKTAKIQLTKANMFNKDFMVKEKFDQYKWRVIATEQRDILGYTCMKAEYKDSLQTTTVWFTPQIQLGFGPSGLHGLPGLILAASVGENKILLAKSIDLKAETVVIKPLEDKNSMPRAEYTKLIKERSEEMRKMFQQRRPGQ